MSRKFKLGLELKKASGLAVRLAREAGEIFDKDPSTDPLGVFKSFVDAYPDYFQIYKKAPRGLCEKWLRDSSRWDAQFKKELKQLFINHAGQAGEFLIVPDDLVAVRERELSLRAEISAKNAVAKGYVGSVELAAKQLNKWQRLASVRSRIYNLVGCAFDDDGYLHVHVITVRDPIFAARTMEAVAYLRDKARGILAEHLKEDPGLSYVTTFECQDSGSPHLNLLVLRRLKSVNTYPEPDPFPSSRKESVALGHEVWERRYFHCEEAFSKAKYYIKGLKRSDRSVREEAFFSSFGIHRFRIFDSKNSQRLSLDAVPAIDFACKSVQELSMTPSVREGSEGEAAILGFVAQSVANLMQQPGEIGKILRRMESQEALLVEIDCTDLPEDAEAGCFFPDRVVMSWHESTRVVLPEPRAPPSTLNQKRNVHSSSRMSAAATQDISIRTLSNRWSSSGDVCAETRRMMSNFGETLAQSNVRSSWHSPLLRTTGYKFASSSAIAKSGMCSMMLRIKAGVSSLPVLDSWIEHHEGFPASASSEKLSEKGTS